MRTSLTRIVCSLALVAATLAACKSHPGEKLRTGPLYERVDKEQGLHEIAAKVTAAVKGDDGLKEPLAKVDMARFEQQLAAFLCHESGGPCPFNGAVSEIWKGATLDEDQFMALMEVVIAGMTDANLPQQEQNDLIDLMMKSHEKETAASAAR